MDERCELFFPSQSERTGPVARSWCAFALVRKTRHDSWAVKKQGNASLDLPLLPPSLRDGFDRLIIKKWKYTSAIWAQHPNSHSSTCRNKSWGVLWILKALAIHRYQYTMSKQHWLTYRQSNRISLWRKGSKSSVIQVKERNTITTQFFFTTTTILKSFDEQYVYDNTLVRLSFFSRVKKKHLNVEVKWWRWVKHAGWRVGPQQDTGNHFFWKSISLLWLRKIDQHKNATTGVSTPAS